MNHGDLARMAEDLATHAEAMGVRDMFSEPPMRQAGITLTGRQQRKIARLRKRKGKVHAQAYILEVLAKR